MDDPYKSLLPTIPHKIMAVRGTPRSADDVLLHAGVVGTLKDSYIHNVPLPRVPQIQSASLATLEPSRCIMARHTPTNTHYSQVP